MVHLIYDNSDGKTPIGWTIEPTTEEEQLIAAHIRDLQFFGFDNGIPEENTAIEYNGIQLIDEAKGKTLGNIQCISWIQGKHQNH